MDSLRKLIERLRDPSGESLLSLNEDNLMSIVEYQGVEDFAELYIEFLDAIRSNTTVTSLLFSSFSRTDKPSLFPIINPLCMHLPRVEELIFRVKFDSPVERFLCKEAKSFTTVSIIHDRLEEDDEDRVLPLDLNPDLQVFEHSNRYSFPSNGIVGPVLLSLPFPSKLRELVFDFDLIAWNPDMARRFTEPELNRLVDLVQVPSLVKLELDGFRFETEEECSRLARALTGSPVQDLSLHLYTPDPEKYRSIVSAFAEMPKLKALKAYFDLDDSDDKTSIRSFSIPLGDLVRRSPRMKSLTIRQCWKGWDKAHYQDLAAALRAPMCGLETLDIDLHDATMNDAATIMATFSAPSSSIKEFTVSITPPVEKEDVEAWLLKLPRTTALRSLEIHLWARKYKEVRELQEKYFGILSRWFYLERFVGNFNSTFFDDHYHQQLGTLMRLNMAGRHYLTSPTPSKADGAEVLIKVREYLNDIYTHLLENPCLCDRAVAATSSPTASPIRKKARQN